MLKNRKTILITVLACLVFVCLTLSACDLFHEHKYGKNWLTDDDYHWRKCESCGKISKKSEHTVNWEVDSPATETQQGSRHGNCSVCGKYFEETIPSLGGECSHEFVGQWITDDDYHWRICSACNETVDKGAHTIDWIIDTPASATQEGARHGTCSVCDKYFESSIPVLGGDGECQHSYTGPWKNSPGLNYHWKNCDNCGEEGLRQQHSVVWIVDRPATSAQAGSKHSECSVCKLVLETQIIDKLPSENRSVELYAINDFHGEVDKISTVGGYLKERVNTNSNTVLINSGDMFQGSMESNSNYGDLLSRCMSQIGFDAFTFGNHEFDWGLDNLEKLAGESSVPFLGANIYHWNASTKTWGTFASEFAQKYAIKTLDNGLKVGIIGVIGQDQITSISSNLVQTIGFKDPLPIIKELSTELRNQQGCDIVVVSAHVGPQGLVGEAENNMQPSTAGGLKGYVDAVFCAHTHRAQVYIVEGIPFIQGGSNGSYVSRVKLNVSADGGVTVAAYENVSYNSGWPNLITVDQMIDNSNEQIKEERNQVLANVSGNLNKNPAIPRLVSRAVAEYAFNQGYTDVVLAMVNTARTSLSSGSITYSNLYEAIPFDNEVYIARVKGSEIINEVRYGVYYWRASGVAIESSKYYKIAIIDYLLFHQNAGRDYNYFRSAFESGNTFKPVALTKNGQTYNYRQITRDYLLANPNVTAATYSSDNNNTDTDLIQSSVTLSFNTTGSWQYSYVSSSSKRNVNVSAKNGIFMLDGNGKRLYHYAKVERANAA